MKHVTTFTASGMARATARIIVLATLVLGGVSSQAVGGVDLEPVPDDLSGETAGAVQKIRTGGASWVESAGGVDLGVVEFGFRGERREWNVGIGRAVGFAPRSRWSFVGAGLSVTRPPLDDDALVPARTSPLDGVEVKPWVGGCMNCPLGEIVQLGLELKWAPGGAALMDDENTGPEGSAGVSLGVQW